MRFRTYEEQDFVERPGFEVVPKETWKRHTRFRDCTPNNCICFYRIKGIKCKIVFETEPSCPKPKTIVPFTGLYWQLWRNELITK